MSVLNPTKTPEQNFKDYRQFARKHPILTTIVALCFVAAISWSVLTTVHGWKFAEVQAENQNLKDSNTQKDREILRLETMLTPFRTIALQRFTGSETEALGKLAVRMRGLEDALADTKDAITKSEFVKLDDELRRSVIQRLQSVGCVSNLNVGISHAAWVSPDEKNFTTQLASLFQEAGLRTGPPKGEMFGEDFGKPITIGVKSEASIPCAEQILNAIRPILQIQQEQVMVATNLPSGDIRIHFTSFARPIFSKSGAIVFK